MPPANEDPAVPKFAANLSFIFQEVGFLDRFAAAAACGFKAVEYLSPYDHPPEVISLGCTGCGYTVPVCVGVVAGAAASETVH